MATRCRYCFTPAAGRPWMRQTVSEKVRCWMRRRIRMKYGDGPQMNYYTGYNAPVYPDGWVIR